MERNPTAAVPTMTLAISDTHAATRGSGAPHPVAVLAPRDYQERAVAVYEDAELLLSAILPEARIAHVGASAVPGAYSKGDVDLCVAVPRDGFREALGVLGEAGFTLRAHGLRSEQHCTLDAPASDVALSVQLIESGSRFESFMAFRDALRGDALLLARYNAVRIDAATRGGPAYAAAKAAFIRAIVGA